jgi:hypothetical protein
VLRVVLPFVTCIPCSGITGAIAACVVDVCGAVKTVVPVDVYVAAAPSATPTPAATERGAHCNADAKRERARSNDSAGGNRRVVDRRIRISRRTINNRRVIGWHIHYLWLRLLNYDYALALYNLGLDSHLFVRFKSSCFLCLPAHSLYGVHHVALLREKNIAQIGGPLNVVG